jgi:beta-galactosidase
MKTGFIYALFIGLTVMVSTVEAQQNPRMVADFNKGWKFNLGEQPEASAVNFSDGNWRTLNLPHDWGIVIMVVRCQVELVGTVNSLQCQPAPKGNL